MLRPSHDATLRLELGDLSLQRRDLGQLAAQLPLPGKAGAGTEALEASSDAARSMQAPNPRRALETEIPRSITCLTAPTLNISLERAATLIWCIYGKHPSRYAVMRFKPSGKRAQTDAHAKTRQFSMRMRFLQQNCRTSD